MRWSGSTNPQWRRHQSTEGRRRLSESSVSLSYSRVVLRRLVSPSARWVEVLRVLVVRRKGRGCGARTHVGGSAAGTDSLARTSRHRYHGDCRLGGARVSLLPGGVANGPLVPAPDCRLARLVLFLPSRKEKRKASGATTTPGQTDQTACPFSRGGVGLLSFLVGARCARFHARTGCARLANVRAKSRPRLACPNSSRQEKARQACLSSSSECALARRRHVSWLAAPLGAGSPCALLAARSRARHQHTTRRDNRTPTFDLPPTSHPPPPSCASGSCRLVVRGSPPPRCELQLRSPLTPDTEK